MSIRIVLAAASLLSTTVPVAAQRADFEAADLHVRMGEAVEVVINDRPVRFRIMPDAVSVPTVNADAAEQIGLKPSMIGYRYIIGPEALPFRTDSVRYEMQGATFRRRTAFSDRQVVEGADAVAGPATFPHRRTILTLREPRDGDCPITFPIDQEMGRSQTGILIDVDGHPVYAAFSFDRAASMVSATGGRWIADAHDGWFEGEARDAPIFYGVSRPVRSLALKRPLMIGELEVRNLEVRVSDLGSSRGIAEGAAPEPDLNEIVITADSKRAIPNQRLYVGMDTIGHCASITYDFDANTITLMCPAQPPAAQAG